MCLLGSQPCVLLLYVTGGGIGRLLMKVYKTLTRHGTMLPLLLILCISLIFIACGEKVVKPLGLGYHAMAYDSESKVFVIFGGQARDYAPASITNTTWTYNTAAGTWAKMEPEVRPFTRPPHAMDYDSESDLIVLFIGETWTYDYNTNMWEKKDPGSMPKNLNGTRMAYDAESDRMILFGGSYSD